MRSITEEGHHSDNIKEIHHQLVQKSIITTRIEILWRGLEIWDNKVDAIQVNHLFVDDNSYQSWWMMMGSKIQLVTEFFVIIILCTVIHMTCESLFLSVNPIILVTHCLVLGGTDYCISN